MLSIENVLLVRAELCYGSISLKDTDPLYSVAVATGKIWEVLGEHPTLWVKDAEAAMWQSLLAREVLISGGLD